MGLLLQRGVALTIQDDTWFTIKYVIVTLVFLLMLWGISRLVMAVYGAGGKKSRHIRFVEKSPMGVNRFLLLVEVEGIYYLVGVDKNGMTLLDKRTDIQNIPSPKVSGKAWLSALVDKKNEGNKSNEHAD